jgi:hypothetical protein
MDGSGCSRRRTPMARCSFEEKGRSAERKSRAFDGRRGSVNGTRRSPRTRGCAAKRKGGVCNGNRRFREIERRILV